MKILYANNACDNLFTGFFNLAENYFIDVFSKSFEIQDINKIRETIVNRENGYTWKGKIKIFDPFLLDMFVSMAKELNAVYKWNRDEG